jgi:hypothetical protein
MKWPLVTRKTHEAEIRTAVDRAVRDKVAEVIDAKNEAALWRVEYRKIRDWIVDTGTHPGATPQVRAVFAGAVERFGRP